ncbi:porin family protein [Marinigracilibium pacificum]|uniref:PorT family protein n=1 Tax=Marinigracilibium pacificum TaxID=2729599 RepID=A0A848JBL0_9BACT|nr:porin family protein [Marinigracilibium pacificum]NMM50402.1 PorT family protein [Marinigracilibium pacificum]
MKKIFVTALIMSTIAFSADSQILISLILGDKLNSGKIEFGLEGGLNMYGQRNLDVGKIAPGFNLGFYFDILLKENLYLHTGVLVKSNSGANGLSPYSLNNPGLDSLLEGGEVKRKLNYFYIPVLAKYKFPNRIFVEGGVQTGLLYKANDNFIKDVKDDEDLNYRNNIRDQYNLFDFGVALGTGYRLIKGNGMNLGVRYYHGLTNVVKKEYEEKNYNYSLFVYVNIPVGAGKAKAEQSNSGAN